jgi:pimeloyl-ACP methyl ester carboxylesterase
VAAGSRRARRGLDLLGSLPRRGLDNLRARRRGSAIRRDKVWLTNASGYRLYAELHSPDDNQVRPGVVLVPGRDQPGSIFCGSGSTLSADQLAYRGFRVLHFDPVGRGRSWGHDDFCGMEGQDSLRTVLDYFVARRDVQNDRVGVVSFDLGLALAAPVLARDGVRLGIRFLLDWEGPADRDSIIRSGPLPPAARTALAASPAEFWDLREPIRWIDQIPCDYIRIQAREDHANKHGWQNALELVARATQGFAASTRLNGSSPDVAWRPDQVDEIDWAPSAAGPLNRRLVAAIDELLTDVVGRRL